MTAQNSISIIAENASEFRVYVVQYWSHRRDRVVREYADAIPEADLQMMDRQDRQKVLEHARRNLGLPEIEIPASAFPGTKPSCTPAACSACSTPCSHK